jgi:hypothetical protein
MSEVVDDDECVDPDRRAPEPASGSLLPAPAINLHPIFQQFSQLAPRLQEIPRLRNDVAALEQANTRLEEQLSERVQEVEGLGRELQERERDLWHWNEELDALRERVALLEERAEEREGVAVLGERAEENAVLEDVSQGIVRSGPTYDWEGTRLTSHLPQVSIQRVPPLSPEVIKIVAYFFAGSDVYGSLSSMCSMNRTCHDIATPVLYGTLLLDGWFMMKIGGHLARWTAFHESKMIYTE